MVIIGRSVGIFSSNTVAVDIETFLQNINQNNDITSNVTGNNNTATNTQDNSINGFGAAARSKYLRDKYVADVSRFVRA